MGRKQTFAESCDSIRLPEKLSKPSMPAVEAFRDALVASRSRAMAGKAVRALSSILTEAQRRGLVAQNVAKGVKVIRPSRDRAPAVIPTKVELKAMVASAEDDFRPMLLTANFTGLRSSELRGLRWQVINLKTAAVTVAQRADQWGVIGSPKSKAGYRSVPRAPAVVAESRAWKLRCPKGQLGLAFPNGQGGVVHHSNLLASNSGRCRVKLASLIPKRVVSARPSPLGQGRQSCAPVTRFMPHAMPPPVHKSDKALT